MGILGFGRRALNAVALAGVAVLISAGTRSSSPFPSAPGQDPWSAIPNDPDYVDEWQLFSTVPPGHRGALTATDQRIGSGNHVDRAWQYHTGTPRTLIAVFDSGINWEKRDLAANYFVNARELPLPEGSDQYDANGDGRISASDWAKDSRVSDRNQNGFLDPEDLILVFSDGVDDDRNGYVDDIAGWDYHEHDNNPADRTKFGHGTGEAIDSVAGLNNGIGTAGICGNCSVVFMRINDSFLIEANAFAAAVIYAADLGVDVIQAASGSLNNNPYVRAAADYAWQKGTIIIGSAADENSFHHNFPATVDPIIYPNSIRHDTIDPKNATTFLNFNNCSNYGARVDVSVASRSCSSEATGKLSGIAALAQSFAVSRNSRITPGELASLIKSRATDINLGSNANEPDRYSTWAGWDLITGYGRVNGGDMLKAIAEDAIPPAVRITDPEWFHLYRRRDVAAGGQKITVHIEVPVPRSGAGTVELWVARGVEAVPASFQTVRSADIPAQGINGEFATLDPVALLRMNPAERDHARYRDAWTLRLIVRDSSGNSAEARRTFFLFDDPDLLSGFPHALKGSGESAGVFHDLDGDGREEFVTADGGGYVHAFTSKAGTRVAGIVDGFPAETVLSRYAPRTKSVADAVGQPVMAAVFAPIAVGDLDGDRIPEIVAVSMEGDISVIEGSGARVGQQRSGWPRRLPFPDMSQASRQQIIAQGIAGAPVLVDFEGNGRLAVVVAALDGFVYAFNADGSSRQGFPVALLNGGLRAKLVSSPAIADVNFDGVQDLVLGSNHVNASSGLLFAVNGLGMRAGEPIISGFPARLPLIRNEVLPMIGTGVAVAPVIGDVDGDGTPEIFIHGFAGKGYLIGFDGRLRRSLDMRPGADSPTQDDAMISGMGQPTLSDVDGDGVLDPVTVGMGRKILVSLATGGKRIPFDHLVGAWSGRTGQMRAAWPRILDDTAINPAPVSADLDGDGKRDIVVGSGGYYVHAFNATGEISGFPKFTGGWTLGSPSLGDFDGDGRLDVAATTREGNLLIWKTQGRATQSRTGMTFKSDSLRSGSWQGE